MEFEASPHQLQLFEALESSPAPEKLSFEELTQREFPSVHIELSGRLKSSWHVEWKNFAKQGVVTVPQVLNWAPTDTKRKIFEWALLMKTRRRQWSREKRTLRYRLEEEIRRDLKAPKLSEQEWDSLSPQQKKAMERLQKTSSRFKKEYPTQGVKFDLKEIFAQINREYFNSELDSKITWSNRVGGQSTHTSEPDPEGGDKRSHLITISQGYNADNVNEAVLGGVVYHECLHIAIPPVVKNGRRIVHSPEFKKRERMYQHYAEWMHWHEHVLRKNLRTLRFKKSMRKLKGALWGRTKK